MNNWANGYVLQIIINFSSYNCQRDFVTINGYIKCLNGSLRPAVTLFGGILPPMTDLGELPAPGRWQLTLTNFFLFLDYCQNLQTILFSISKNNFFTPPLLWCFGTGSANYYYYLYFYFCLLLTCIENATVNRKTTVMRLIDTILLLYLDPHFKRIKYRILLRWCHFFDEFFLVLCFSFMFEKLAR